MLYSEACVTQSTVAWSIPHRCPLTIPFITNATISDGHLRPGPLRQHHTGLPMWPSILWFPGGLEKMYYLGKKKKLKKWKYKKKATDGEGLTIQVLKNVILLGSYTKNNSTHMKRSGKGNWSYWTFPKGNKEVGGWREVALTIITAQVGEAFSFGKDLLVSLYQSLFFPSPTRKKRRTLKKNKKTQEPYGILSIFFSHTIWFGI